MSDPLRVAAPTRLRTGTRELTVAALVTALLAASAWISIPLGTIPVTLQVFVVLLAILLLRPATATAAVGAYLVLGAIGVPVFSGGVGGPGVLMGPTGGYIAGFLLAAGFGAAARAGLETRVSQMTADVLSVVLGIAIIYLIGWIGLQLATGMSGAAAFAAGVAPFLVADFIKGAVAIGIAGAVRRAGVL